MLKLIAVDGATLTVERGYLDGTRCSISALRSNSMLTPMNVRMVDTRSESLEPYDRTIGSVNIE